MNSGNSAALSWIALLLGLILAVNLLDLYLDHFGRNPQDSEEHPSEAVMSEQTSSQLVYQPPAEVVTQEPEVEEEAQTPILTHSDIKLQILNGCGVRGIAARVRGIMRDRGFDVMSYGNAEKNESKTLLLVRSAGERGMEAARITAESIGVSESQIRRETDPSIVDIDVTIIIGGDHAKLNL